jgi:N6-adenosine-specific RNA methylase IME4
VIVAPRGRHSEKPDAVYEMIERDYPSLPKIELFARARRDGWRAWGNELPPL